MACVPLPLSRCPGRPPGSLRREHRPQAHGDDVRSALMRLVHSKQQVGGGPGGGRQTRTGRRWGCVDARSYDMAKIADAGGSRGGGGSGRGSRGRGPKRGVKGGHLSSPGVQSLGLGRIPARLSRPRPARFSLGWGAGGGANPAAGQPGGAGAAGQQLRHRQRGSPAVRGPAAPAAVPHQHRWVVGGRMEGERGGEEGRGEAAGCRHQQTAGFAHHGMAVRPGAAALAARLPVGAPAIRN